MPMTIDFLILHGGSLQQWYQTRQCQRAYTVRPMFPPWTPPGPGPAKVFSPADAPGWHADDAGGWAEVRNADWDAGRWH